MGTENGRELPDLPGLESVEIRIRTAVPILVGFLALIGAMESGLIWFCRQYHDYAGPEIIGSMAILAAMVVYALIRFFTSYLYMKTDGAGMHLRKPIGSRFIPWHEVTGASVRARRELCASVELRTPTQKIRILPHGAGSGLGHADCFIASIWQHLRRLERSGGMELTDSMKTLWEPIPDDVPLEISWGQPPSIPLKIGGLVLIAFFPAMLLAPFLTSDRDFKTLVLVAVLAFPCGAMTRWLSAPDVLHKARVVRVDEAGLDAQLLFRKVSIPWSRIVHFSWLQNTLHLRSFTPRLEVRIPYAAGSIESEHMMMAIFRCLRSSSNVGAVPLPISLAKEHRDSKQNQKAFLARLSEPARKRVRTLYAVVVASLPAGIVAGSALLFADLPGRLSGYLYGGPTTGTRFFIAGNMTPALVIPLFVGWFLPSLLTYLWAGRFAGPYKAEWAEFSAMALGKPGRFLRPLVCLMCAAWIVVVPLWVGCYTRVTDRGVAVNRFLGFGESFHSWGEVKSVEINLSRPTRIATPSYEYCIRFTDGSDWTVREGDFLSDSSTKLDAALGYIAAKSGRPVMHREENPFTGQVQ